MYFWSGGNTTNLSSSSAEGWRSSLWEIYVENQKAGFPAQSAENDSILVVESTSQNTFTPENDSILVAESTVQITFTPHANLKKEYLLSYKT